MACPCKVVGFGLMGAAVLILAGKSLTKSTTATTAPRSLSAASRQAAPRSAESQAVSRMRSQSRQVVGTSSFSAPEHPIGHAHERMVSMVREREAPSLDAVMGRLRSRRTVLASSGYSTLAQRRRARRSPIVGS